MIKPKKRNEFVDIEKLKVKWNERKICISFKMTYYQMYEQHNNNKPWGESERDRKEIMNEISLKHLFFLQF